MTAGAAALSGEQCPADPGMCHPAVPRAIVPARPRNPDSTLKSCRKEPRSPRPAKEQLPVSFIENMERAMHIEI